jgi:hypothetical protein
LVQRPPQSVNLHLAQHVSGFRSTELATHKAIELQQLIFGSPQQTFQGDNGTVGVFLVELRVQSNDLCKQNLKVRDLVDQGKVFHMRLFDPSDPGKTFDALGCDAENADDRSGYR